MGRYNVLFICLALYRSLLARGVFQASEVTYDTYGGFSWNRSPDVAVNTGGEFVVVWMSVPGYPLRRRWSGGPLRRHLARGRGARSANTAAGSAAPHEPCSGQDLTGWPIGRGRRISLSVVIPFARR